jgi:hypothetical protein
MRDVWFSIPVNPIQRNNWTKVISSADGKGASLSIVSKQESNGSCGHGLE